jgi:hypothetical protein
LWSKDIFAAVVPFDPLAFCQPQLIIYGLRLFEFYNTL